MAYLQTNTIQHQNSEYAPETFVFPEIKVEDIKPDSSKSESSHNLLEKRISQNSDMTSSQIDQTKPKKRPRPRTLNLGNHYNNSNLNSFENQKQKELEIVKIKKKEITKNQ